jgi:type IV pilus assembly protein PilY1
MRIRHRLSGVFLLLLLVGVLPLRTHGGQGECANVTTSLASTIDAPVNGDEAFFKLPTGPANLMLLMDTSGSMAQFVQCGDNAWDGGAAACTTPSLTTPTGPQSNGSPTVVGTCTPYTDNPTANAALQWMEAIVPKADLPDPGHPANSLMNDHPTWGTGCTGDNCMFAPDAYYRYGDWSVSATSTSATRRLSDSDAALKSGCKALSSSGSVVTDYTGQPVDLGAACGTCMTNHGFYFYKVAYKTSTGTGTASGHLFKGTFLNANPPKFVTARKVIKDLAFMDPANPTKLDQVRLGLSILFVGSPANGATLVVPFGPDKGSSFPTSQANFAPARQAIIDAVNTKLNDQTTAAPGAFHPASTSTPLASALFAVGQYFTSIGRYNLPTNGSTPGFGSGGPYSNGSWEKPGFFETAPGTVNASWAQSGANQCSVCWACQTNSVIIVTDGAPNSEMTMPTVIFQPATSSKKGTIPASGYDNAAYVAACGDAIGSSCGGGTSNNAVALTPRVADWLHNNDLRTDLTGMGGKQALNIHAIGFGLTDAGAINVLKATATLGGGIFQNAADAKQLQDAVWNAVNRTVPKENSFSAATASSLQTQQTAASESFLTRFRPNTTVAWEGHLFKGALFDEWANGCDNTKPFDQQPTVACGSKTVSANFDGDQDSNGNAICTGIFLVDADCDIIVEDAATGDFIKKGTSTPANFPWDAGGVLSDASKTGYRSADENATNARSIFTWIDGARVDFTAANVATIKPYLSIDSAWCTSLLAQLGLTSSDPTTDCAKEIIWYVRGWDVTDIDADGCSGPGNPTKNATKCPGGATSGEERNRANDNSAHCSTTTTTRCTADSQCPTGETCNGAPTMWKLGDIFHSSPAVVWPPFDEFRCDLGFEKQCLSTLHSPPSVPNQTAIESDYPGLVSGSTTDAYDRWRLDNRTRKRVVLVGANDGMLHAFDAGSPDSTQPADAFGVYPIGNGTGEELWAFIPPDLLPRLKDLLSGHQYMVDGNIMVRDVWVDANSNSQKEKTEYHTMAIVGERSGGTQWTALDVTDPTSPTVKWAFPPPGSDDAKYMGESWADFPPRPPPIGPVKIANSGVARGFDERWVVMINGGYDPALMQGRAVFMLDVWTGRTLWRFTDDDFKSQLGFGSGTSMFSVPAGVAMFDVGNLGSAVLDADLFYDTATWGDLGGNLWVARFQTPGTIDASTHRVSNWFAARAFEEQRRTDDLQYAAGRSEFYSMTANVYDGNTKTVHTYLGSGNREHMMQQGAACGPDNLLSCCQGGCDVTASQSDDYGTCGFSNQFSCTGGALQRPTTSTSGSCTDPATCAGGSSGKFTSSTTLQFTCPGVTGTQTATAQVWCDGNGVCSTCNAASGGSAGPGTTNCSTLLPVGTTHDISSSALGTPPRSRFYGVWSYGRDPKKTFSDLASARTFDANRFTDRAAYSGTCYGPTGGNCVLVDVTQATLQPGGTSRVLTQGCANGATTCWATQDDAGWFYEYGDRCPAANCGSQTTWTDEKTASGGTVLSGCAVWSGFRPYGQSTSTDPCSGSIGTPLVYQYSVDFLSGMQSTTCGYLDASTGIYSKASPRATTAPPSAATVRVTVNPKGQVQYSTLQIDPGPPPSKQPLSTRSSIMEQLYWLEVPRQLHSCRHVSAASCE